MAQLGIGLELVGEGGIRLMKKSSSSSLNFSATRRGVLEGTFSK
jgi:hypothetical protein